MKNMTCDNIAFEKYLDGIYSFEEYCNVCAAEGITPTHIDDARFEECRRKVSAILFGADATEQNPWKCDIVLSGGVQGLSDAEKPHVVGLFQDCEGIVWLNIEYLDEPIEFDDLENLEDARTILHELYEM